jgi:hypothetical protein
MFEQYFGVDAKKIGYFFGLVVGAVVVVTLLYWFLFGFNRWTGEMQQASNLMMAAAVAPMGQTYAAPAGQAYAPPSMAGQYVCPRDGAVGLPRLDANGVPHCPLDGLVMSLVPSQSAGLFPAAAPG